MLFGDSGLLDGLSRYLLVHERTASEIIKKEPDKISEPFAKRKRKQETRVQNRIE